MYVTEDQSANPCAADGRGDRRILLSDPWPLVGRDDELEIIRSSISSARHRGVTLVGEPGVGKTRLALETAAWWEAGGGQVIWVTATPAMASIPMGAFVGAMLTNNAAGLDRLRTVEQACDSLLGVAEGRRLLLCVDDAQLLDPLSAAVVTQAVTSLRVALLATERSGQDAAQNLTSLWKDGWVERVDVSRLSRTDSDELIGRVLGSPFHGAVAQRLWEVTGGNMLFLREFLLAARSTDALRIVDGLWCLTDPVVPGPRMTDLVTFRLAGVSDGTRRVVELVAWSEPVAVDLLAMLATTTDIDEAEAFGALTLDHNAGRLVARLTHPVYGEVVRTRMPRLRSQTLQRDLADALELRGVRSDDDILRLATWRLASGGSCDAALLARASSRAVSLFDYALGERLAQAALDAGGDIDAVLQRADCLYRAGRFDEAEVQLSVMDHDGISQHDRAGITIARALNLMFGLGRPVEAEHVLEAAETALVDAGPLGRVLSTHARVSLARGQLVDAIGRASAVLDRDDMPPVARLSAAVASAPALALSGRADEAVKLLEQHKQLALDHVTDYPQGLGMLLQGHATAKWFAGELDESVTIAELLYQLGLQQGSREAICAGAMTVSFAALAQGRPRTAMRWAREALGAVPDGDRDGLEPWCNALLAEAAAVAGDHSSGVEALDRIDQTRRPALRVYDAQVAAAQGWVLAAGGELTRAATVVERAATAARADNALSIEALLLHHVARFGFPERVIGRLNVLAAQLDSRWVSAFALHVNAVLLQDPDLLVAAADGFVALGSNVCAAEASLQAARAHRARGRESSRRAAAARSSALLELCEGAQTPVLREPEGVQPLTRREREIATLASVGLSSPTIASRLTLSVRTVEGHLHRLYTKLGVSCRDDLAARL